MWWYLLNDDDLPFAICLLLLIVFIIGIGIVLFSSDEKKEPVYECKTYEEQKTCTIENVCIEQVCVENCE